MPTKQAGIILQYIRKLQRAKETTELSDRELLRRFAEERDEAAFATLVRRHGAMVLHSCQRVLHNWHDAEDVYQATFLVLARKAAAHPWNDSVGTWLYLVAHRLALNLRDSRERRWQRNPHVVERPTEDPQAVASSREVCGLLDEELSRLPEKYRAPLVLCSLEGFTREEAARQLGCSLGTFRRRLERGRTLLRHRLIRRGLPLPAILATVLSTEGAAQATLPLELIHTAVHMAIQNPAATTVPAGLLSSRVAALAESMLKAACLPKVNTVLAAALAVCIAGTGAGLALLRLPATKPVEKTLSKTERAPNASGRPEMVGQPALDRYGDPLPHGARFRLGTLRFRHGQNVSDIAFSPDSKTLAAVDTSRVCLWDAATGKELRRLERSTSGRGVAFSPDGKILATATNREILYWDPASGQQLGRFPFRAAERVCSLSFSPDGKMLAWLTEDNTLRLSDAATGKVLHQWPGPLHVVESSFSFSPGSRMLALACQKEKEIPLYDTATGEQIRRLAGHRNTLYTVAFSPDRKTLVSSARDDTLRWWDVATGKELRQVKHTGLISKLAFSPDGRLLATGGWNPRLWEAATGKLLRTCERDDDGDIGSLAFSPDGKTLAASRSNSHALSLWDVASGKKRRTEDGHLGIVQAIAVSPDGRVLASAAWEKNYTRRNAVHLWDPATGEELGTLGKDLGFVGGLAFSPDGRLLAAGNEDGTVRIWDLAAQREVGRLAGHENMVEWVGFTGDGKILISLGYHDRTIHLWDVATGKELRQFPGNPGPPGGGMAVTPDGKMIAQGIPTGGRGGPSIVLWDAATGKAVKYLGDDRHISALALSPDGRSLASGRRQDGVRLWDLATGKEICRLADPNDWIGTLAFSADGRTLASGGDDGIVRLWEIATGTERCRFVGHRDPVCSGAFSPDGRKFFSGSQDTTVLIWDVTGRAVEGHPAGLKLSQKQLKHLRSDLAARDASRADRAIWTLVAAPEQAVALFRNELRPVVAAHPELMAGLLADLNSDGYARRERAAKEIYNLGEGALPALRKALAARPPLEVRRRVEQLLEELAELSSERLYALRAVEILEHIASAEARPVLGRLAQGMPGARLTEEAKASLQRLANRPATKEEKKP